MSDIIDTLASINATANATSSEQKIDVKGNDNGRFQFYGDALPEGEANKVVDIDRPKVIVFIGFAGYGKTTYVSTFYKTLLDNGTIGNMKFVDSDTIIGFERRVFLRWMNDKNTSDTPRTQKGANPILTLKMRNTDTNRIESYVISDNAGELYDNYRSEEKKAASDQIIENADLLAFFVDEKITASFDYMSQRDMFLQLLRRLKKSYKIHQQNYMVCYTKADEVKGDAIKLGIENRKNFEELLASEMGSAALQVFQVDSRNLPVLPESELYKSFELILSPVKTKEPTKGLNWVKYEIAESK